MPTVMRVIGRTQPRAQIREVYFIRAKTLGHIKIGVSDNSRKRLALIQKHSPDELELLGVLECRNKGALEKQLHLRFAADRLHGEWFTPSPALMEIIQMAEWPEPQRRRIMKLWEEKLRVG